MNSKITSVQLRRKAYVYVRQSSPTQILLHHESTERQYQLRQRAIDLGWTPTQVEVIDADQGRSGQTATPERLPAPHRRRWPGAGRRGLDVGSLAPGTQQWRLVSADRDLRRQPHADRR